MNAPTPNLQSLADTAIAHHSAGRLRDAEILYHQILQQSPENPDILYLLGVLASQARRDDLSIDFMQRSIKARPSPQACSDLGRLFVAAGKNSEAVDCFTKAIELNANNPDYFNYRGNVLVAINRLEAARVDYERAITLKPDHAVVLNNYAGILYKLGQNAKAFEAYQRAIAVDPNYAEAYHNFGYRLFLEGRIRDAIGLYRKAITLKPDFGDAHNNLGNALHDQNMLQEAMVHFNKAIEINPRAVEPYNNIANVYKGLGHLVKAVDNYKKAVELKPDLADAWYNMGQTYREMGQSVEALACYDKALAAAPNHVRARWAYAMMHIPLLLGKAENLGALRQAIMHQVDALDRWFNRDRLPLGYQAVGVSQPFYIAYQEENNTDILGKYGRLCSRLMEDWQKRQHYEPKPIVRAGRIRVGIVSSHIRNHSVWFALLKGWIQHLNHDFIDLYVFSTTSKEDEETDWARQHVAGYQTVGQNLDVAVKAILSKNLDVLIYPEIGMERLSTQLAAMRLAPTQMVSWGHPETTGLPTLDYYLSAEEFEPENAIDNYTELLIRLPHLGCCYQPFAVETVTPDFAKYGLHSNVPLLLSPGVPFKYAPQHDQVFIEIVKKLGDCQIVFFTTRPQDLSIKLQARFRSSFEKAGLNFDDKCVFVPWMDRAEFYGLMKKADVFIDTIGFSGFNTAIQAIECGLPIVTREGKFMRGRLASGILRRLEMTEMIAPDNASYVDLAVRMATDKMYNRKIRQDILDRRSRLFNDRSSVDALQQLILNVAERA